jgi:hypothetical protein
MRNLRIGIPIEHFWTLLKQRSNEFMTLQEVSKNYKEHVCLVVPNFNDHDCMALYVSMLRRLMLC